MTEDRPKANRATNVRWLLKSPLLACSFLSETMTSALNDPSLFFEEIARPSVGEFLSKPDELRPAVNAVLTLDAVSGDIYAWAASHGLDPFYANDGELPSAYARWCEPMGHLHGMANALKHSVSTRSIFFASASDIQARRLGRDASLWDHGRRDSRAQLCFDNPGAAVVILEQSIASSMAFLQSELIQLKLQKESVSP